MISRQRQKQNTRHNKRDKETLEEYYEVSQQSYVFQRQIVSVGLTKICLKTEKKFVSNNYNIFYIKIHTLNIFIIFNTFFKKFVVGKKF